MVTRKPNESEEEYFARVEAEKKKKLLEEERRKREAEERERLKQLHWMRCPKCGMELEEVVFKGVRVDRCKGCNGVWLDNGELEQLAGSESTVLKNILSYFLKNK